ncbi:MAG: hypothetical protein OEM26_12185 [Saprospiraceae bacterium]|nr:hypothetical protein [Saprospiraceae bacterium]
MIRVILIFAAFAGITFLFYQNRNVVSERTLVGTWELVIEDLDDLKTYDRKNKDRAEMDLGDRLESALKSGLSSFFGDLLEDFEIRFVFEKNNQAKMEIDVLGGHEIENLEWEVLNRNQVAIREKDSRDKETNIWILENGKLISTDLNKDGELEKNYDVYMTKGR